MIALQPPFRRAELKDAGALAELVNFAGEGLPLYLWDKMREPGETAWALGRRRAAREEGSFSYRNAVVAEIGGACAACLIGYPQPSEPEPIDYAAMPPMFVPLQELENLAPATWYVNVLAAFPDYRGQGLGTRLLALAEQLARAARRRGLSVIVSDANDGARRLYLRCDYVEAGERPMVKEGWRNEGRNWVLLTKRLPA
ncbi:MULTISPECIES: GNAT family N-acetyltransferase [Rhodomicrobium]|uniref:GNAT family N-acetyltransferase n=1 Tax=Rhodomicrobium TaxID=1068 RepID=UPI000B4AEE63|nr:MULTISPECIES: GNAT family N-acetyltransferase [Rhodomicrobium]